MLLDVYSASLKCTPLHLSVEGEEAETLVFGKTIVVIHHQMLEVVANGNLILALPWEISRTGREECGKCTGEVALGGELIDGYSSNRDHIMVAGDDEVDGLNCRSLTD